MAWSSNDALASQTGRLLKPALNARRLALQERLVAVNDTLPSQIYQIDTGELILSSWFSQFQTEITALIPKYVNHTDNSGNWNGQSSIPVWTEADILTAIGDETRIPAPTDPLVCASWLKQQYKIINLLRWTIESVSFGFSSARQGIVNKRLKVGGYDSTWIDCKSSFDADAYNVNTLHTVTFESSLSVSGYLIWFNDGRWNYTTNDTYQHSTLVYIPLISSWQWFNLGSFNSENKYWLTYSAGEEGLSQAKTTNWLLESQLTTTPYPPEPTGSTSESWWRVEMGPVSNSPEATAIRKFDGANGFTYKDW